MTLLDVRGLRVAFGGRDVVRGIDFTIARGEKLALVGESGSGKTVTARAIMRLNHRLHVTGSIRLDGTDLLKLSEKEMTRIRGSRIGMVFQDPMDALNPLQTVGDQVAEPLIQHGLANRATFAFEGFVIFIYPTFGLSGIDKGKTERAHP